MSQASIAVPPAPTDFSFLHSLVDRAILLGATDVEVITSSTCSLGVDVRNGDVQGVSVAESSGLTINAFVGQRKARLVTNNFSTRAITETLDRVVATAKFAPEDPYSGLAPAASISTASDQGLELFDPTRVSTEELTQSAREAEAAARAIAGVTACDGSRASWISGERAHVASNGLALRTRGTTHSLDIKVMAERGAYKEIGAAHHATRWKEDLISPSALGVEAGQKGAAKLGARKLASRRASVIFDEEIAMQFLAPLLSAMSGAAIARGQSFVRDCLGTQVLPAGFSIIENPTIRRGRGSRVADAEGLPAHHGALVEDGVLRTWLLNCASARQLKLTPTGHAGGASNLNITPGALDQAGLMREAGEGLLVNYFFGPSLNPNSGDWSAGVAGFWFERGEIAFPVSEITVAGNLRALYPELIWGNDIRQRGSANAPSLLAPQMSIGGK